MARPRKVSDDELLRATARAIGRYGPQFTLAQVAAEAGVATATAAARIGSKRELLRWMASTATAGLRTEVAAAAGAAADPVDAVRAATVSGIEGIDDPSTAMNHLAQLGSELADPELRTEIAAMWNAYRHALEDLVAAAALPGAPPPAEAARLLAALVHGTQVLWAVEPRGELRDELTTHVDTVLRAWGAPP
ncbi:TetR family transcriptional regulator C-terminal domain-containing protein [Cryptosporangium aurantiacum]|uniref:Transcriptional regulator, TetR family n=1 Tax=Cryptosporangium aurantiacum TaxID=134849 RepID=A0A1M7TVL4_9ACTN|nr:TetR family transcriptional regulator C-terminal domain-containing protein [Cryptosporangium aurantiacum]SHN74756.1 transcriptional regulator, TetR family [Cryptosporangium aurantiacum]